MSATTAGAMKAYLEAQGRGVPWFRDGAPRDADGALLTTYPFGVVQEGIGYDAEQHGDTDDLDAHDGTRELVQLDLYQLARGPVGANGRAPVVERYDLPPLIERDLRHAARGLQTHAPFRVYGATLQGGQRWPISGNVVRHTWTLLLRRDTERLS